MKEFLKYLVAGVILVIPLYPKFPLVSVPGTFVSIRAEDLYMLFVVLIWFFCSLNDFRRTLSQKITKAVILFFAISLVSVASGIFITKTVQPHIALLHWLRRVEYILPLFIGISIVKSQKDLSFFIKCLVIVIFYAFLYGVGQKYFDLPIITTQNYEYSKGIALRYTPGGHLTSTFAGHYDLATFLVFVLPIFVVLLVCVKASKSFSSSKINLFLTRSILLAAVLSGFWLLVNSVSRISILSYLLGTTISLIIVKRYKFIPLILIFSILFVSFSSNLISRYTQIIEVTLKKFFSDTIQSFVLPEKLIPLALAQTSSFPQRRTSEATPTPTPVVIFEDRSTSIRLNVEWPRAIRAFQKNVFLGTGFSSITLATDNDYLRLLGETGALGFMAFILILLCLFKTLFSKLPLKGDLNLNDVYLAGVLGGVTGVMLNALFIDVFEASKFAIIFWLLMGFAFKSAQKIGNE